MSKRRQISEAERTLWESVARQAEPLHPKREKPDPKPPVRVEKSKPNPKPSLPKFAIGAAQKPRLGLPKPSPIAAELQAAPLRMDARLHGKMKKGRIKPEARLDLHGMTLAEAHPALISFVIGSHSLGRRLVLVITGKGKDRDDGGPIPTRLGVLRHQVPVWLARAPMAPVILQVRPAAQRHGGEGALYVYLKKS